MAAREWGKELDDLYGTLKGGVAKLTASAGVQAIDHWTQRITEAEPDVKDDLKPIGRDLSALKKLLDGSEELDGKKIGKALVKLAEHIENSADSDDVTGVKGRLRTLGSALRSEGENLTSGSATGSK